jgi:hypothetical protein
MSFLFATFHLLLQCFELRRVIVDNLLEHLDQASAHYHWKCHDRLDFVFVNRTLRAGNLPHLHKEDGEIGHCRTDAEVVRVGSRYLVRIGYGHIVWASRPRQIRFLWLQLIRFSHSARSIPQTN